MMKSPKNISRFIYSCFLTVALTTLSVQGQNSTQEAYISFDKPFYTQGETVWFSLFVSDKMAGTPLDGVRFMELSMVNKTGAVVNQQRVKVENGRVAGQIDLSQMTQQGNYLLVLGYPSESVENYVYSTLLPVYSNQASGSQAVTTERTSGERASHAAIRVTTSDNLYGKRSRVDVTIDTDLSALIGNSVSVVVRKNYLSDFHDQLDNATKSVMTSLSSANSRDTRPLSFNFPESHGSLLYRLERTANSDEETAVNAAYIIEDQQQAMIFEEDNGNFTLDASNLSSGSKTFFFNHFYFLPWSDNRYRYVRKRWMNGGEMELDFVDSKNEFKSILPRGIEAELKSNATTDKYRAQQILLNQIKEAYPQPNSNLPAQSANEEYVPGAWYNINDYALMQDLPEFLREIVSGLKFTRKDGVYDFRFSYPGDKYRGMPLMIVNGVPTLNVDKVFKIPLKDIEGVGVLKDLTTSTELAKQNREDLKRFGYFGENGILFVKLKPNIINPLQFEFGQMPKKDLISSQRPYTTADYSLEGMVNIPDFRTVLYWNPIAEMDSSGKLVLSFLTSDDNGEYEILVEGISKSGEVIKSRKVITIGTIKGN